MGFSKQEYWSGLSFPSPVDHTLSDLSTMTHPSRWPHMAWLSFIELDKAVVYVIRLAGCLWFWFQSVCPLMPSLSAYRLTWVSLTLDMGYLFTGGHGVALHRCSSKAQHLFSGGDGIPVELFQILKDMLWMCCTQYASKFGKLSSGHRTGIGQFSFQPQRKAMPKYAQTTTQLRSSHMLVK